ncbi:MAG: SRPBCC family protein [Bacteroidales bacterium]|jgi:effector-binding domain-containing protein|nr:SRPBCC family protein [Bacteroidales bacterium]
MKALKTIGIILLAIIVLFLLLCLFLPKDVHTEGSTFIKAPEKVIFEQVNNFRNWEAWSPFAEMDTTIVTTYEGSEAGIGAIMKWTSEKSGNGMQTIVESIPNSFIKTDLDFYDQGKAVSIFTFSREGDSTKVTWSTDMIELSYPFGRFLGLFMNGMMQKMYSSGFAKLTKVAEAIPPIEVEILNLPQRYAIIVKDSAMVYQMDSVMSGMFGELFQYTLKNQLEMAGAPFTIYYSWDDTKPFVMEAGIPISNIHKINQKGRLNFRVLPPVKVGKAIHFGSYEKTGETHMAIQKYFDQNHVQWEGFPWEVYVTDPIHEADTSKWITEIYYPIK